jgi:hypothetical protein
VRIFTLDSSEYYFIFNILLDKQSCSLFDESLSPVIFSFIQRPEDVLEFFSPLSVRLIYALNEIPISKSRIDLDPVKGHSFRAKTRKFAKAHHLNQIKEGERYGHLTTA